MPSQQNRTYLLGSLAGAVAVVGITILIYGTFFQNFLENFEELSPHVTDLITRDNPNVVMFIIANLAHGILIATVIRWGKFYSLRRGAAAAAIVALLTDVYFTFTQAAAFKTMSITSAICDAIMWTLINAIVGALVAWILGRRVAEERS